MTTKLQFTMARCAKLECPPGRDRIYYRDTQTAGLCLCVTAKGARIWYGYRWFDGKPVRVRIGRFPAVPLDTARKLVDKMNVSIAEGVDPRAARRACLHEPTLYDLWQHFAEYGKNHKKTYGTDERQWLSHLFIWRARKASAITKVDVQKLHAQIGNNNGHYMANRILILLHSIYARADNDGIWKGPNPATGVTRFQEQERDRFLQPDELPRFFKALEQEPNEGWRDYFMVSLLAGVRRGNVLAMRWDEVDLVNATWTIPKTKSGKPVIVVLVPAVVDILRRRQQTANGNPWVFPSTGRTGHLIGPRLAWKRLLTRADIKNLRIHDLRRTFGSYQAATGASLPIIGKSLGHTSTAATQIYARLNLDPVRQSVTTATDAILAAGNKPAG